MSRLGALHLTHHTGSKHSGTVIFFHGSGSSGADMKEWVRLMVSNFSFPHIKVMYPTAPLQPYSPVGGQMSKVWFDRAGISPNVPEKLDSIANMEVEVRNLIKKENDAGIPTNRIIIGGFSMGGALAFHSAYRWDKNIAAAFAFSSFLNENSAVYNELTQSAGVRLPPLLQIHGNVDDLVDLEWGKVSFNTLKELGVQGEFYVMERLGHSINKRGTKSKSKSKSKMFLFHYFTRCTLNSWWRLLLSIKMPVSGGAALLYLAINECKHVTKQSFIIR